MRRATDRPAIHPFASRGSHCTFWPATGRSPSSGSACFSARCRRCSRSALGIYGVVFWIGESNFPGPLFGGVAVLSVLGIQGFILALIGEYLGRIQRDVEGRPIYTHRQRTLI